MQTERPAVLYARANGEQEVASKANVEAQLQRLREYAASLGFRVVKEFTDACSREAFAEMINFLANTKDAALIVERTDRLYRNIKDWVILDELDLEVHFARENFILSKHSRSNEKFIHGIKVLMAKQYVENLSEGVIKGMNKMAERGIYPSGAPLGYKNVRESYDKRTIIPDPDTAPLVVKLFKACATGKHSPRSLSARAVEYGLLAPRSRTPLSRRTVSRMLRNPFYAGRFRWKGKEYAGTHQPIVSQQLWDQVQGVLASRATT